MAKGSGIAAPFALAWAVGLPVLYLRIAGSYGGSGREERAVFGCARADNDDAGHDTAMSGRGQCSGNGR